MVESIVLVIVVSLFVGLWIVRMGIKFEEKKLTLQAASKAAPADVARLEQVLAATQAEMTKLRERVQVLERLATDDDRRLSGEIDRLREEARR